MFGPHTRDSHAGNGRHWRRDGCVEVASACLDWSCCLDLLHSATFFLSVGLTGQILAGCGGRQVCGTIHPSLKLVNSCQSGRLGSGSSCQRKVLFVLCCQLPSVSSCTGQGLPVLAWSAQCACKPANAQAPAAFTFVGGRVTNLPSFSSSAGFLSTSLLVARVCLCLPGRRAVHTVVAVFRVVGDAIVIVDAKADAACSFAGACSAARAQIRMFLWRPIGTDFHVPASPSMLRRRTIQLKLVVAGTLLLSSRVWRAAQTFASVVGCRKGHVVFFRWCSRRRSIGLVGMQDAHTRVMAWQNFMRQLSCRPDGWCQMQQRGAKICSESVRLSRQEFFSGAVQAAACQQLRHANRCCF